MSEFTKEEVEAIEAEYDKLMRDCPKCRQNEESTTTVRKAFDLAYKAHYGIRRRSGEPYIFHPLSVARIVSGEMGLGVRSVVCSLLHDVVEDTDYTIDDIRDIFDSQIAAIIDGLTKIKSALKTKSSQAENIRKMLLTMSDDARVILVKLADRLHNMRTLDSMILNKQLEISEETRMLFVPLAHRLGFNAIKTELEDLCLKFEHNEAYNDIQNRLKEKEIKRQHYINRFSIPIMIKIESEGFEFTLTGRPKSVSSIYNKIHNKKVPFEEIYDLLAIRIILHNVNLEDEKTACWRVYSLVTDVYQPNPDRLRDWITSPRENGYESLHTTVMGPEGRWVEVQIRTTRMDEIAERGLAAHWKYKGTNFEDGQLDIWLKKLKQTLRNPDSDAQAFLDEFKLNLYTSEIFVFTRDGDLKRLPIGSTVLDFAFDIHSNLGCHAVGGKINRHNTVPLDYKLQSGDQIEIITSEKQIPQKFWLDFVVTAKAKNNLHTLFRNERKTTFKRGKAIVEIMIKELGFEPEEHIYTKLLQGFDCGTKNELYTLANDKGLDPELFKSFIQKKRDNKIIGYWKLQLDKLFLKSADSDISPVTNDQRSVPVKASNNEVITINENQKYVIASCCNPIPGDKIIGVQRGSNLSIHKENCVVIKELRELPDVSFVTIKWIKQHEQAFLVRLRLSGFDRMGLLNDLTQILSKELEINIRTLHFDTTEKHFDGFIDLYILDLQQLNTIMSNLQKITGVKSVTRAEKIE